MEEQIKRALRIQTNLLDDEIEENIQSAKADLRRVGVDPEIKNPLIHKAIELYCKWQMDYREKGLEFETAYCEMRDSLKLSTLEEAE